jgi:hypothetical protein
MFPYPIYTRVIPAGEEQQPDSWYVKLRVVRSMQRCFALACAFRRVRPPSVKAKLVSSARVTGMVGSDTYSIPGCCLSPPARDLRSRLGSRAADTHDAFPNSLYKLRVRAHRRPVHFTK